MSMYKDDSEYYYYSDEEREVLPEKRNAAQGKFDRLWRHQRRNEEQMEREQLQKEQEQLQMEQEVDRNLREFVHKFNSRKETTGTETTTGNPEHRRTSAGAGIARFRNRDVQEISRETYRKELLAKRFGETTRTATRNTGTDTENASNLIESKHQPEKSAEQSEKPAEKPEQPAEKPEQPDHSASKLIDSNHQSEKPEKPETTPEQPSEEASTPKEPAPEEPSKESEESDILMPPPMPEKASIQQEKVIQRCLETVKELAEKKSAMHIIENSDEEWLAVREETLIKRAHEETLKLNETRKPGKPESIAEIELPESPQASPERVPDPDRDRVYTFPPHLDNNAEFIGSIHQHIDYSDDDLLLPRWLSDEKRALLKKYQGTLLHFTIDRLIDEKAELANLCTETVRSCYRQWLYHFRYPECFAHNYFDVILLLQEGWLPQIRTLGEHLGTFTRVQLIDLKPMLEIVREEFLMHCCHSNDLQRQFRRLIMKHLALLNVESHVDDYKFMAKEQHAFQKCYMPLRWDISYSGGKHATLLFSYQAQLLYRAGVIELPHIDRWLKFRARDFALNNRDESADEYSSEETPNEDDYFYYPDLNPVDPLDQI